MLNTSKEYNEYLNSYEWKAIKAKKLEDNFNCESCGVPATTVHHLSYERLGKILETDIVSLCESCHKECHFIDGEKIKNDENILKKRYEKVKLRKQKEGIKNIFIKPEEEKKEVEFDKIINSSRKLEKNGNLYNDQLEVYDKIIDFLKNDNEVFILKGAAGTGKTTLLKEIKNYFIKENINFFFGAPTGKATYVLKDKLNLTNPDTYGTIYSILYEINDSLDKGNKDVNYFQKIDLFNDCVYVIDESSLINYKNQLDNDEYQKNILNFGTGSLLKDIFSAKKSKSTKIIFVGDIYQLPPIKDQSRALDKNFLEEKFDVICNDAELTEIKRQKGESGILDLSVKIRNDIKNDNYCIPFLKGNKDITLLKSEEELLKIYGETIDNSIVISYTNKKVLDYNKIIRKDIKKLSNSIEIGDKIMVSKNTFIGDEQFLNGEIVEVKNIHGNIEIKKDIFVHHKGNNIKNDLKFLDVTIEREFGKEKFYKVKILLNSLEIDNGSGEDITLGKYLYSEFMNRIIYSEKNNPNGIWKKTTKGGKIRYYKDIDNIDEDNKEFFKTVMKEDKYLNSLEIKYGYAITCHKSQGSEWKNIFLDINDYQTDGGTKAKISKGFFNYLYTGITRGELKVYILNNDNLLESGNYIDYSSKFGIEENFINEYINKIGTIIKKYHYELESVKNIDEVIENVIPKNYKVEFIFSNGSSKANITINYDKKHIFGKAQLHNKENPFTNNLGALLLKHNLIKDVY